MASRSVNWHEDAFRDLVEHDQWRAANEWDPIALEIIDKVNEVFGRGSVFPKRQARFRGELLPVFKKLIEVRSKRFGVYFVEFESVSLIRRVLHPNRNTSILE